MPHLWRILLDLLFIVPFSSAQETHDHRAPEKLGKVSFPISCKPAVQEQFDRGVALLHSFAYTAAENAFQGVAEQDPQCAMAHWGIAMTYFHQLWEPPIAPATISIAQKEIQRAQQIGTGSERERQFIHALGLIYQDAATVPYRTRALNYEHAMSDLAAANRKDVEAQVFYALALLANASPADKTHAKQKQAADLLEPLDRAYPEHPGIPHYLIHAYDNAELAPKGLAAARAYSQIAPSAPHALHMPSHIFTRLGLWDDSIASNLAAREAAHQQGDTGEELHAMDYLVYAYLQSGRDKEAAQVIQQLKSMPRAERWRISRSRTPPPRCRFATRLSGVNGPTLPPSFLRREPRRRLSRLRSGLADLGSRAVDTPPRRARKLTDCGRSKSSFARQATTIGRTQVGILKREVMAWSAQADGKPEEAADVDARMRPMRRMRSRSFR